MEQSPIKIHVGAPSWTCPRCGAANEGASCNRCGRNNPGGGFHPLALFGWILLLFTAPIYPFAGGAALLGFFGLGWIGDKLGLSGGGWFIATAIATVVGFFLGFKLEQRVSEWKLYRVIRFFIRLSAGIALIAYMMQLKGSDALPGGETFGAMVLLPFLLWLLLKLDRVVNTGGQEGRDWWDREPGAIRKVWYSVNGPTAVIYGFPAGILGFLIGQDTRILFGLFSWAFVTFGIVAVRLAFKGLGAGAGLLGAANKGLGGFPRTVMTGVVLGAIGGAVLGQILDHRVQYEAVVIGAVFGLVLNLVRRAVFR